MDEELEQLIVHGLWWYRSRGAIIEDVCERGKLQWPEAEQLVKQVETEQAHRIARGQIPLIAFLSTATVAAGMGLLLYSIQALTEIFRGDLLTQILSVGTGYYPLVVGGIGGSMIAGGMVGLYKALLRFFET